MVVRDMRLLDGLRFQQLLVGERRKGDGCHAHHGAVACIAFVGWTVHSPVRDEASDATPTSVADVGRSRAVPIDEALGDVLRRKPHGNNRPRDTQGHLRVVGDLAWPQPQPAAAGQLAVNAVLGPDLRGGHEFHGGAKRIANSQPEQAGPRALAHVGQMGQIFGQVLGHVWVTRLDHR